MAKFLLAPLPITVGICFSVIGVPRLYELLGGSIVVFLFAAFLPFMTLHDVRICKLVWATTLNLLGLVLANYFISSLAEVQLRYNLLAKGYISLVFFMYWSVLYVYPVFYFLPVEEKKGVAAEQIQGAKQILIFCVMSLFVALAFSFVLVLFASDLGGYSDGQIIEILLGALIIGSVTANIGVSGVSTEVLSQLAKPDIPVFEVSGARLARLKRRTWIVLIFLTLLTISMERYRGNWVALGLTLILIVQTAWFLKKFLPLFWAKPTVREAPAVTLETPKISNLSAVLTGVILFIVFIAIIYVAR